jgi:hypothetical protein
MIGIVYLVPVHHGWLWFPENQGLVSGLIIGAFGLGSLIFDNVSTSIVNPQNLRTNDPNYDAEITSRFTLMLRYLWVCYLTITCIGLLSVFRGPKPEPSKIPNEEDTIQSVM